MRMFTTEMRFQSQKTLVARIVMVLIAASLLTSCTIPITGVLFNNSNSQIVAKFLLDENEVLQIEIAPKTSEKLKDWLFYNMRIMFEGTELRYDRVHPGFDFVNTTGFGPFIQRRVFLEFESDGRIFVLKSSEQFGDSPPTQPEGFPLAGK